MSRDPTKPIDDPPELPPLPEPATTAQILHGLVKLDALSQELLMAQRLQSFPGSTDGSMPVPIHPRVRGMWAHQLRKLGFFCIPELATHEFVQPDGGVKLGGPGAGIKKMAREDLWEAAKKANPELARQVEAADTPEKKQALSRQLLATLPVEQRIAMERLADLMPKESGG